MKLIHQHHQYPDSHMSGFIIGGTDAVCAANTEGFSPPVYSWHTSHSASPFARIEMLEETSHSLKETSGDVWRQERGSGFVWSRICFFPNAFSPLCLLSVWTLYVTVTRCFVSFAYSCAVLPPVLSQYSLGCCYTSARRRNFGWYFNFFFSNFQCFHSVLVMRESKNDF